MTHADTNPETDDEEISPAENAGLILIEASQLVERIGKALETGRFELLGIETKGLKEDDPSSFRAWVILELEKAAKLFDEAEKAFCELPLEALPNLYRAKRIA